MRHGVYSFIPLDHNTSDASIAENDPLKNEILVHTQNFLMLQTTDVRGCVEYFAARSEVDEANRADCGGANNNKHCASAHVTAPRDYCNFAIFQQDKGLLISQRERQALPFGTLRGWINAALTSRLRDYPNYSAAWDLMQVRIPSLSLSFSFRNPPSKYPLATPTSRFSGTG